MDNASIENLLEIMATLRDPARGCAWDRAQSFASIAPHTIEEAYEVADAIERGAIDDLAGELGDLLFQVVFYAQLAREEGRFDFADVVTAIAAKLVRRHPHVFGAAKVTDLEALAESWESIKREERTARAQPSVLAGIPTALPGL